MIFLDRQFKKIAVLQGRQISQGKLKAAMGRVVGKSYKNKFAKMTREYIKLLNLLDRLDSDRRNIDTLRARTQGESGKASRRKLEKKLAKKQGEYDKEMQEWEGRAEAPRLQAQGSEEGQELSFRLQIEPRGRPALAGRPFFLLAGSQREREPCRCDSPGRLRLRLGWDGDAGKPRSRRSAAGRRRLRSREVDGYPGTR